MAFEIALGSGDVFLIGVISLLVVVIFVAASSNYDPLGARLWPPPTTFGSPFRAFVGSLGRCPSAVDSERLFVALDENSPDYLLCRGVPSSDVKQLLCGL
jgi:hypothetical protein